MLLVIDLGSLSGLLLLRGIAGLQIMYVSDYVLGVPKKIKRLSLESKY